MTKKLYDVYFMPTQPMVICVEAESKEEAKRIIEEDDGELLDYEEAMNRFSNALEWNESWKVVDVEELDEDDEDDEDNDDILQDKRFYYANKIVEIIEQAKQDNIKIEPYTHINEDIGVVIYENNSDKRLDEMSAALVSLIDLNIFNFTLKKEK